MYTSVPRAHHRALVEWRVSRLGLAEASVVALIRGPRVGTGLTNGATEEGQGFGILGVLYKYDGGSVDIYGSLTFQQQWRVHYRKFAGLGRDSLWSRTPNGLEVEVEVQRLALPMW